MSEVERRPRGLVAGRPRAWWVSRAAPARPGRSAGSHVSGGRHRPRQHPVLGMGLGLPVGRHLGLQSARSGSRVAGRAPVLSTGDRSSSVSSWFWWSRNSPLTGPSTRPGWAGSARRSLYRVSGTTLEERISVCAGRAPDRHECGRLMGPLRTTLIVPTWSQPQIIEAPDPVLCRDWQACSGFQLSAEKPLGYAQLNEGLRLMATCDLVQILLRASA